MIEKIRLRNDNILVRLTREPTEVRTQSGLVLLPQSRAPKLTDTIRATVEAVGPGRVLKCGNRVPSAVEPGDVVILHHSAGEVPEDFTFDEYEPRQNEGTEFGDHRIVREDEIMAVVE